ncbi:hypothetical protein F0224_16320 [Vibrio coralliilyticus]|uniref:hypothetical protein n=1 Tax=Vibrio coralliilyticus TaxID=190893 RepID=UPI000BAC22C5|nr:hypothetical protein [Vibrio coralliilyticus]NOI77253.1 hypothetical protein [Vibrio coralliilyticus]PAW02775.1 hypothetical protein CKJ79_13830 [Vibrio coralliilyticus]
MSNLSQANLRTATVTMVNNSTQDNPATMTITNAFATQGEIITSNLPVSVENNGGSASVEGDATSPRQGIIGYATYVVQNIEDSSVKFTNTMSARRCQFQIGNGGPTLHLEDNGQSNVTFGGFRWNFQTQSNNLEYNIVVTVSRA